MKPKLGLVYRNFWDHVMGIPADDNNKYYNGIIPSAPPVILMLSVPKAQKALQECVRENQKSHVEAF